MILPPLLHGKKIILASSSPRRQMLLKSLGIPFEVVVKEIDERCPGAGNPEEVAKCLALMKADEFSEREMGNDTIIITADTIVVLEGEIIGKPNGRRDAIDMLKTLSGRMHLVYTGVCIKSTQKTLLFSDLTKVWFAHLTDQMIEQYVDDCQPYDKAGAYGIQEWIGYAGVERIDGSFFNVMGFPTHRIYEELTRF